MARTEISAAAAKPRILVVDDDENLLRLLTIRLRRAGYGVDAAAGGRDALARARSSQPDVVITDVRMPGLDGMALFESLRAQHPTLPVIILTAHGTIPDAVEATRRGVFAYLTKPFDSDELLGSVDQALQVVGWTASHERAESAEWRQAIITRSPVMEALLQEARLVAQSDSSVLLQGASGTGKELLARAIHKASPRRDKPFLPVNCTAIPEALFESELFGHRKGSFTGASHDRRGILESADGGTVFLDEIGDMPLPFQAKLLRALQEREVRPVGASAPVAVDLRVISATNQDLEQQIGAHEFREDLYYRLNVVRLELPPLAERREDIPLLAEHFLAQSSARLPVAMRSTGFSREAMELLVMAPWPGNVRQLRNVVEQCAVLATSAVIPGALIERALRGKPRELLPLADARARFEFDYLVNLLQITDGNVAYAARLADRNRSEFYKLLRRHGLEPNLFRGGGDAPAPEHEPQR
jgi:two-component system response regulator GlrR